MDRGCLQFGPIFYPDNERHDDDDDDDYDTLLLLCSFSPFFF